MKNAVLWDVTPCGSCKNRRFGGALVLSRATRHNISEDGILQRSQKFHMERFNLKKLNGVVSMRISKFQVRRIQVIMK
jgi:hypothetical protein